MSRSTILVVVLASTSGLAHADTRSGAPAPGTDDGTSAIVGGSDAPPGKWPDTVAVLGSTGVCSGTLIAPDVVLTAGHCAEIHPTTVVANTTNYAVSGGIKVGVSKTVAYPNWKYTFDVSVIVLSQPINGVTPRKIGTSCTYNNFLPRTAVRLVGFGATDMQGETSNTVLKEAMTAVSDPTCSDSMLGCNPEVAPGGEFVAGGTGTADSCFGDSGGPVYLETERGAVVVGAVSRGVNGSATPCGGGGIYVRTDGIVDWIEQTTGRTIAKDECTADAGSGSDRADTTVGEDVIGGCSVARGARSGGPGSLAALGLALAAIVSRRRRSGSEHNYNLRPTPKP